MRNKITFLVYCWLITLDNKEVRFKVLSFICANVFFFSPTRTIIFANEEAFNTFNTKNRIELMWTEVTESKEQKQIVRLQFFFDVRLSPSSPSSISSFSFYSLLRSMNLTRSIRWSVTQEIYEFIFASVRDLRFCCQQRMKKKKLLFIITTAHTTTTEYLFSSSDSYSDEK